MYLLFHRKNYFKNNTFRQFNGSGSYGNGAAMRVHPVALHCHGRKREEMEGVAKAQALLTHSHKGFCFFYIKMIFLKLIRWRCITLLIFKLIFFRKITLHFTVKHILETLLALKKIDF